MHLAGLTIALRPRSSWEAVDLGMALVREHALRIWQVWILVTLPVVVFLNTIGFLSGHPWIGGLAMWWLKPVFDRIPLFVLSRAVFGASPSVRETLRAQWSWGWRGIWPWLLWRRFHPSRAMLLSVDLLENLSGASRGARSRVLLRAVGTPSVLLTLICVNIEIMLSISIVVLGFMFVPIEFFSESTRAMWENLFLQPPLWAQLTSIFIGWLAMSVIEPFYVGAGFGLYLNRRTQLEAWDIELAFRRIAARLTQPLTIVLFGLAIALTSPVPALAAPTSSGDSNADGVCVIDGDEAGREVLDGIAGAAAQANVKAPVKPSMRDIFAWACRADNAAFKAAVIEAYKDTDLNPKATVDTWQRRYPLAETDAGDKTSPTWARALGGLISLIAKSGLWILIALLLLLLIRYHERWLPWVSDKFEPRHMPEPVDMRDIVVSESLPDDVPAAVRRLWQQGQPRAALALLYRAAVHRLTSNLGTSLPLGATESDCLRHARRLPDQAYAKLFSRIVRCWQSAAYAQRMPSSADVESLLDEWNAPRSAIA